MQFLSHITCIHCDFPHARTNEDAVCENCYDTIMREDYEHILVEQNKLTREVARHHAVNASLTEIETHLQYWQSAVAL